MNIIHDVDALLILAIALAAKRKPAELVDIIAASELLHAAIPGDAKLIESFARLGRYGMLHAVDGAYGLTPAAHSALAKLTRKDDADERLFSVKKILGEFTAQGETCAIDISAEALTAAIAAHRAAAKLTVKNLLMPKAPRQDDSGKGPGLRQRKPLPGRSAKPGGARSGKAAAPRRRKV